MKNKILNCAFAAFFLGLGLFSAVENSDAYLERGEWVDFYGGETQPQYQVCASDWWTDECVLNDKKGLPTAEITEAP